MNKIKFNPIYERILVERLPEEEKTAGGLYIPENAKEKPQMGIIVAAGKGKIRDDGSVRPMEVKTGDKILFSKYACLEIKLSGKEYIAMNEDDVIGIIL